MVKSIINFGDVADEHDNRHKLKKDAASRDSIALMLLIPEQNVAGWVYPTVNGEGVAVTAVCLFGDAFESPIFEQFSEAVPAEMDFYDWKTGGLTMKIGEPHRTLSISWRGDKINLDFEFEALHPSYAFSMGPEGSPPYYGDDRTEQHGVITGRIEAAGKSFDFETIMVRDHSWGPRVWGLNQHHKWVHAATRETSFHFFEMQSFGKTHLQGFLHKDGLMSQIKAVDYDFQLDDNLVLKSMDVTVTDMENRTATAACTVYAHVTATDLENETKNSAADAEADEHYSFDKDQLIELNEAALKVSIDGRQGVGWAEFSWNRNYFLYARQYSHFKK